MRNKIEENGPRSKLFIENCGSNPPAMCCILYGISFILGFCQLSMKRNWIFHECVSVYVQT